MTWPNFRRQYEAAVIAALPRLDQQLWRIAADDFQRLAAPASLGDVAACLPRFEAALRAEGVDAVSVAIYLRLIGDALAWSGGNSRAAA